MKIKDIELKNNYTFGETNILAAYIDKDANGKFVLHLNLENHPKAGIYYRMPCGPDSNLYLSINDEYAHYYLRREHDPEHGGKPYNWSTRAAIINKEFKNQSILDSDIIEIEYSINEYAHYAAAATIDFVACLLPPDYELIQVHDYERRWKIVHVELSGKDVKNFIDYYHPIDG